MEVYSVYKEVYDERYGEPKVKHGRKRALKVRTAFLDTIRHHGITPKIMKADFSRTYVRVEIHTTAQIREGILEIFKRFPGEV